MIDYYLHNGRERLHQAMTAMADALRLSQRAVSSSTRPDVTGSEPAPLQPGESIDGLAGLYEVLNRDDPHYCYDFAVTAIPPAIDQDEDLLVAAVQQATSTSCVTVKIFARFREAVVERPVPGSFTVDPSGNDDLVRDLERFYRYGRPFQAPAGTVTTEMDLPGGLGGRLEDAGARLGPAVESNAGHQIRLAIFDPAGQLLAEPLIEMAPATRGQGGSGGYGEEQQGAFGIELLTDLSTGNSTLSMNALPMTGRRPELLLDGLRCAVEFRHPNQFRIRPPTGPDRAR